jgi:hypothetical protein
LIFWAFLTWIGFGGSINMNGAATV